MMNSLKYSSVEKIYEIIFNSLDNFRRLLSIKISWLLILNFKYHNTFTTYWGREGKKRYLIGLIFSISKVLVVTGKKSIDVNGKFHLIEKYITKDNIKFERVICEGEPTASYADELIRKFHGVGFEGVISIGGGSVIDLGKALSAIDLFRKFCHGPYWNYW